MFAGAGRGGVGYKFCTKVARILHAKWIRCSEGCADFPAFWARGPNQPFVYFLWDGEDGGHPKHGTPQSLYTLPYLSTPSTCLIVQTSRLHWTLFAYSRRRRLRRVAFQARRRTCVEVPQSLVTPGNTPPRSTSWPYQLCVMVKSHFNSTKLLLSSRSFHMLDNHPNTLHLHSTLHPAPTP